MTNTEKCILIRYGELFLKGGNRSFFESLLKKNIRESLKGLDFELSVSQARYYISGYDARCEYEITERLRRVFGIHSISVCYKVQTDLERIAELLRSEFDKEGKFRVTVNRADKRIAQTSMQIAAFIGARLIEAYPSKLRVDLFSYDAEINVDIRENGYTYVFFDKITGAGGLPVGSSGKGLLLLSGGIDSPVAGYMAAKRGMKLDALHFHSFPYTGIQAKEKTAELARLIGRYSPGTRLYFAAFTKIQKAIRDKCPEAYLITIMRRFMMRIANRVAASKQCSAIITGESLGQVASQTVESLTSTNAVAERLVLRPLIGFDKSDIISIAKSIGTYDTSILPFEDCCTVFLPKNPAIRPKLQIVEQLEKAVTDADELIAEVIAGLETADI
ncbi:MAG: tRNA 4-thiouridine(8) synthase ThiI [Clostridiales bacterium]|jgi:thiamine biosynthesis protein ThiI|nr:tRNA 4-thiouridine(8) synthase ThiI [Clostridiales bacterium]